MVIGRGIMGRLIVNKDSNINKDNNKDNTSNSINKDNNKDINNDINPNKMIGLNMLSITQT